MSLQCFIYLLTVYYMFNVRQPEKKSPSNSVVVIRPQAALNDSTVALRAPPWRNNKSKIRKRMKKKKIWEKKNTLDSSIEPLKISTKKLFYELREDNMPHALEKEATFWGKKRGKKWGEEKNKIKFTAE